VSGAYLYVGAYLSFGKAMLHSVTLYTNAIAPFWQAVYLLQASVAGRLFICFAWYRQGKIVLVLYFFFRCA
jgi:hypothetical protein